MAQEKDKKEVHDKTNCWDTGRKFIPLNEMTETHLKRAKKYAQRLEEYHWFKSTEFSEKVAMLEAEAERRKIKLPDYRSKYHKNNKRAKEHNRKMVQEPMRE